MCFAESQSMSIERPKEFAVSMEFKNQEGTRQITVFNGLAYYQSTGHSGIQFFWFPFINFYEQNYTFYLEPTAPHPFQPNNDAKFEPGFIVKLTKENIDLSLAKDNLLKDYKGNNSIIKHALNRITLKSALVTCLRLMYGSEQKPNILSEFTDKLLSELGLSDDEINLSKTPLFLKKSDLQLNFKGIYSKAPYEANKWLIERGIEYIKQKEIVEIKLALPSFLSKKRQVASNNDEVIPPLHKKNKHTP